MLQGKYNDAIGELQQLSVAQPGLKGLAHEFGAAYYKKGDYIQAINFLKKALQEDSQDNESTQLLGISYYLSGNPSAAIPFLEKVQAWFPRANVDAAYILGECFIQTKDYAHARQAFASMFDVPQDSAGAYLLTARMLFRQEFGPIALEYAQKAAAIDPKLPGSHFLLGEIHLFQSQVTEAITDFKQELAIDPANPAAYYKLADVVVLPTVEREQLKMDGRVVEVRSGEGLPRTVLEAMYMAKPTVATRVAGTPEQILDGETGLLVPPANPEAIADAIMRLLEASPAERRTMGERARARVRETFTTARMVRETAALYRELLGDAPVSACEVI